VSGISDMAIGKKAMWADRARTFAFWLLAVVVAVLIGVLLATKPAHAKTFTVTTTSSSGPGSLDQAITNANANNNTSTIDTVKFNIPTTDPGFGLTTPGVFTISSLSALAPITEPLTIDGYSQGKATTNTTADDAKPNTLALGNNAVLKIELRRTVTGVGSGLWIIAKNTTIKGLIINRWDTLNGGEGAKQVHKLPIYGWPRIESLVNLVNNPANQSANLRMKQLSS